MIKIPQVEDARQTREAEQNSDARFARHCVEWALDRNSEEYRTLGPDALLAAAQVYATLASRRI